MSYWPGWLSLNDFSSKPKNVKSIHRASSWCYGNISIARGMQKVSKYMGWKNKESLYFKELLKILKQPIDSFNLVSPSLCHGYSSILALRIAIMHETDYDPIDSKELEANINLIIQQSKKNSEYIHKYPQAKYSETDYIEGYIGDLTLLTGSIGIVLSLYKLEYPCCSYDRLLMIDK